VIWAHHDDHRYIGRPYTPWENLFTLLEERNAKGFGIIHWTTRPLDLYFSSSARQVWESTRNEPVRTTVEKFVKDMFGKQHLALTEYYHTWLTTGPMFGRETTDHFIDLGGQRHGRELDTWEQLKDRTLQRLELLRSMPEREKTLMLLYQTQMEAFYLSFFENQIRFQQAFEYAAAGETARGRKVMEQTDPAGSIRKYVDAIETIGFTSGEKALVFSMNARWLADYYNLEQRLGMRPVRYLFSPTRHDPLAQAPGHYTYFIDEQNTWWRCLWAHELKDCKFTDDGPEPGMLVEDEWQFDLQSMHGQSLPPGQYQVDILLRGSPGTDAFVLYQVSDSERREIPAEKSDQGFSLRMDTKAGGTIQIAARESMLLKGMQITKRQGDLWD
jgi:hypothetical protein